MYFSKNIINKNSKNLYLFNTKLKEKTQNIMKEKINKYKLSLIDKKIEMHESHSTEPFIIKKLSK